MKRKNYTKLYDSIIHNPDGLSPARSLGKSGKWHNARPESYGGIFYKILGAWHVLLGKADAIYWRIDEDK